MNMEAQLQVGVDHWKKGELNAAVSAFQEVLSNDANHPFALANLANAYRDQGAIDLLPEAVRPAR